MSAGGAASGGRASWTSNAAELSASQPGASSSREGRPTVVGTTEAVGARDAGAGVCCAAPGGTSPRSRLRMVCVNRALFGVSIVCVCACVLAGDELQPVSLFWFEL